MMRILYLGVISLCLAPALCFYLEMEHSSEVCKIGERVPHCFVTPCQMEETCKNYPDAFCSNNYCSDAPCTTVWRFKGEIVDCGNYYDYK